MADAHMRCHEGHIKCPEGQINTSGVIYRAQWGIDPYVYNDDPNDNFVSLTTGTFIPYGRCTHEVPRGSHKVS